MRVYVSVNRVRGQRVEVIFCSRDEGLNEGLGNQPFSQNLDLAVNTTEMLLKSTTYPSVTATLTLICDGASVWTFNNHFEGRPSCKQCTKATGKIVVGLQGKLLGGLLAKLLEGYWQNHCEGFSRSYWRATGKAIGGLLTKLLEGYWQSYWKATGKATAEQVASMLANPEGYWQRYWGLLARLLEGYRWRHWKNSWQNLPAEILSKLTEDESGITTAGIATEKSNSQSTGRQRHTFPSTISGGR